MAATNRPAPASARIEALDALRGFALCGIIFINIPQTMSMTTDLSAVPEGLRLFVLGKFYPIFYLLFGLGVGSFLRSAVRRTGAPRVPVLRRLLALAVFGALHHLWQPGEVLLPRCGPARAALCSRTSSPTSWSPPCEWWQPATAWSHPA